MTESDSPDLRSRVERLLLSEERWPDVRGEVVALGDAAVPFLIQAARDSTRPASAAERAVLALGELGGPEAEAFIVSLLGHAEAAQRAAALTALRALGGPGHAAAVEPLLADASAGVRREAIRTLGETAGAQSLASLRALAENEEAEGLRESARAAISAIQSRTA